MIDSNASEQEQSNEEHGINRDEQSNSDNEQDINEDEQDNGEDQDNEEQDSEEQDNNEEGNKEDNNEEESNDEEVDSESDGSEENNAYKDRNSTINKHSETLGRMQNLMKEEPYFATKSPDYNFSFGTIPPPTISTPINDKSLQLLKEINTDLNCLGHYLNHAFPHTPIKNLSKLYQESAVEIGTQADTPILCSITTPQTDHSTIKKYKPLAYSPYYKKKVKEEPFRCIKEFYGGIQKG